MITKISIGNKYIFNNIIYQVIRRHKTYDGITDFIIVQNLSNRQTKVISYREFRAGAEPYRRDT